MNCSWFDFLITDSLLRCRHRYCWIHCRCWSLLLVLTVDAAVIVFIAIRQMKNYFSSKSQSIKARIADLRYDTIREQRSSTIDHQYCQSKESSQSTTTTVLGPRMTCIRYQCKVTHEKRCVHSRLLCNCMSWITRNWHANVTRKPKMPELYF